MLAKALFVAILVCGIAPAADRIKLVFSIDQGFGNGIVVSALANETKRIACSQNLYPTLYPIS